MEESPKPQIAQIAMTCPWLSSLREREREREREIEKKLIFLSVLIRFGYTM